MFASGFQDIFSPLIALLASFILCMLVSITYIEYIRKGEESWIPFMQILALLPILIPIVGLMYLSVNSSRIAYFMFLLIFMIVLLLSFKKLSQFKCKKREKIDEIDGVPLFMCHEEKKLYNAWFDVRKKEINFTQSLFDILSEEERKAILYHEIGHSKNRWWRWLTQLLCGLWFLSVSLILTMLFLLVLSNLELASKLVFSMFLLAFLPIYAISFMISSWINEHEADVHAVKLAGFNAFARALIKVHVYNNLKRYQHFIEEIKFSSTFDVKNIPYTHFLKEITKRIFIYLNPQTVFNQPLPESHPPLIMRLKRVSRFVYNDKEL